MDRRYDLAIIGGGINGCGIARDAAGRGLSVYLCEQADLASGTSSRATKLIHGGLRYLEHLEFRLVRDSLTEREVLWRLAPHIIRPLRFVLPHHRGLRPAWLLRLGLFLYDHLGTRRLLPSTRVLDLTRDSAGVPLKPGAFRRGFEYSDCFVDDARLVALNARDAADRGATIRTRTKAIGAERTGRHWRLTVENQRNRHARTICARTLVNAAGPWVGKVLAMAAPAAATVNARLVQGSHIVVPRLFAHDRCYIFQNADQRIIFAIPYEQDYTLIGTTDRDYAGDPSDVASTPADIDYLCRAASAYFVRRVDPLDVVWTYSGVRPLFHDGAGDAQAATRDYAFELHEPDGVPLLSIFGGKITTYRRLAQEALDRLQPYLGAAAPAQRNWSATVALPGGDFPVQGFETLVAGLAHDYPWLDPAQARRLARAYGTRARRILKTASERSALGRDFGGGLSEAEVDYLMAEEWAQEAADIVWRRSKLGLRMTGEEVAALDLFMAERRGASGAPT